MSFERSLLKITVARLGDSPAPDKDGSLAERIASTGHFTQNEHTPCQLKKNRRTLSLAMSLAANQRRQR